MSLHGEFVSDDSKLLRREFDADGKCIRILLFEDWYDRLKPLYDALEWIATGAGITITKDAPDYIQACFDWLEALVFEFQGILVTFSIVSCVAAWVSDRIRLGKFTYKEREYDQGVYGTGPYGLVPMVCELPVEG